MTTFFLQISALNESNKAIGFETAKRMAERGFNLEKVFHKEVPLVSTGRPSNSITLHTAGNDQQKVEELSQQLSNEFRSILETSYGANGTTDMNKVKFDDHHSKDELRLLYALYERMEGSTCSFERLDEHSIILHVD